MEIIRLANDKRRELDAFVATASRPEFLQSFAWGEVIAESGNEVLRLAVLDKGAWMAVTTITQSGLPGGFAYWYSPRGPVFKSGLSDQKRREVVESLAGYLRSNFSKTIFWRLEPDKPVDGIKLKKTGYIQPSQSLLLDLDQSLGDVLGAMHQKTIYNIRLAEKKGIELKQAGQENLEEFLRLMEVTSKRDGFRGHSARHYQAILEKGGEAVRLYLASLDGKYFAAGIFSFFGGQATYIHGASDNENRELMAPYLLHWRAMAEAKAAGCRLYDFYGIDARKWPGVTRFKRGFGGRELSYPGTFDYVFKPSAYLAYNLIRSLRKKIWWR